MSYIIWIVIILVAGFLLAMLGTLLYIFGLFVWGMFRKLSGKDNSTEE